MGCCHPKTKGEKKLRSIIIAISIATLSLVLTAVGLVLLIISLSGYYTGSIVTTFQISGGLLLASGILWFLSGCFGFHSLIQKPSAAEDTSQQVVRPPPLQPGSDHPRPDGRAPRRLKPLEKRNSTMTIFTAPDNDVYGPDPALPPMIEEPEEDTEIRKKKKRRKRRKKNKEEDIEMGDTPRGQYSSRVKTLMSLYDEPEFKRHFPEDDAKAAKEFPKTLY